MSEKNQQVARETYVAIGGKTKFQGSVGVIKRVLDKHTSTLLEACELSEWVNQNHRYETDEPCPYQQQHGCPYPGETRAVCNKCASEVRRAAVLAQIGTPQIS